MAESTSPIERIFLGHFIVSEDVERSARFYSEVLGGKVVFSGGVTYVKLSNSWIIINVGGGPTDDKPSVTLETPRDLDRVSSFLNIRVADIHAVYDEWSARGARIPDATEAASVRDPLLHPRSGRLSDRGRTDHRSERRLGAGSLAVCNVHWGIQLISSTHQYRHRSNERGSSHAIRHQTRRRLP